MFLHFPKQPEIADGGLRIGIVTLLPLLAVLLMACGHHSQASAARKLRVCADPNNLPFSNARGEGFENKLAELLARQMHAELEYTWWAQRRGFIRNTLKAGRCDLVMGVPTQFEQASTSAPYYRSSYVFVTHRNSNLHISSFNDPALRRLKIGVQVIGDDGANAPPAHALSQRGIVQNVRGYTVYGDYAEANPPARILDALAANEIDVAIVWGPLAGYYAKQRPEQFTLTPVAPQMSTPTLPFIYDISFGVRRGEQAFKQELTQALEQNRAAVERILDDYNVPRVR